MKSRRAEAAQMDGAILVVSGLCHPIVKSYCDQLLATQRLRLHNRSSEEQRLRGSVDAQTGYDGPMPQTREHILLSKQVGVPPSQQCGILHVCSCHLTLHSDVTCHCLKP